MKLTSLRGIVQRQRELLLHQLLLVSRIVVVCSMCAFIGGAVALLGLTAIIARAQQPAAPFPPDARVNVAVNTVRLDIAFQEIAAIKLDQAEDIRRYSILEAEVSKMQGIGMGLAALVGIVQLMQMVMAKELKKAPTRDSGS